MKRIGFLILATVSLLGCPSSLLTEPATAGSGSGTIKIAFSLSSAKAAKTVVPDFSAAIDQLEVSLSSNNGYTAPSPYIDTAVPWQATFTDVPVGSWNINVVARRSGVQIGTGSVSNCTLTTAAPLAVTVPMTFNPVGTSGSVKFTVTIPSSTGVDFAQGVIEESGAQATPTVTTAGGTSTATFQYPSLATGTWSLVMTFRRGGSSGTIAGTFREKLIVIAGFESACWVDATGALVSGGRAFDATEFFDTNALLGGLSIAGVLSGTAFSSGSFTYALGLITGLSSTVSFTALESIEGQYLQYSWNNGALTEVRSGSSATVNLSESNTLVVHVTAPDHQTTTTEDYKVTFSKGYRVTYNGNGNAGGNAPVDSNIYPKTGQVTVLGPGTLQRAGYAFINWNTAIDGSGTAYKAGDTLDMGSAEVTLFAHWVATNGVTVTFTMNPAYNSITFSSPTTTVPRGGTLVLTTLLTGATGWHWYVDNTLIGTQTTSTFSWNTADKLPGNVEVLPGQYVINVDAIYGGYACTGSIRVTVTFD